MTSTLQHDGFRYFKTEGVKKKHPSRDAFSIAQ